MKTKKAMVVKISGQTARRLYYQGYSVCTSQDGYTTQEQAQQLSSPVGDSFFTRECMYGFVVPEVEAETIRHFQKQGMINMLVATLSGVFSINFLTAYTLFNNYWALGGFLALSYFCIHYWVKIFEAVRASNNPYLQMMAKYKISINEDEE